MADRSRSPQRNFGQVSCEGVRAGGDDDNDYDVRCDGGGEYVVDGEDDGVCGV